MKRNHIIASLAILIGMGAITVSCKKEKTTGLRKAEIIQDTPAKSGEDDEDPVIQGKVRRKRNYAPIDSALVQTISNATQLLVKSSYTENFGEFIHEVAAGTYYFQIFVPGDARMHVTDTIQVNANTNVTIFIDDLD